METKLKAIRRGHRGTITKLWKNFSEIKDDPNMNREDIRALYEAVKQKKNVLLDLNDKMVDAASVEDVSDEIQETDE